MGGCGFDLFWDVIGLVSYFKEVIKDRDLKIIIIYKFIFSFCC